jgi:hypothetical protein
MNTSLLIRIPIYAAGIFLVEALFGPIVAPVLPKSDPNALGWVVTSDLIVAAVLAWLVSSAHTRGWRLAVGLAAAWFVVASATSSIEAYFFGLFSLDVTGRLLLFGIVTAAGICLMVRADERVTRQPNVRAITEVWTPWHWLSRTAVSALAYVVLYFVAGSIVILMPGLLQFYEQRGLPSPLAVIAVQLFVRGPAFALVIGMLARLLGGSRGQSAVASAAVMSLVGGVAALIIPNAFFPDAIRWYHFVEVTSSNFVFGLIAGVLMWPGRSRLGRPLTESRSAA